MQYNKQKETTQPYGNTDKPTTMRELTIAIRSAKKAAEAIADRRLFDNNMDATSTNTWRLYDMQIADEYSWDGIYDSDEALEEFESDLRAHLEEWGIPAEDIEFTGTI